MEIEPEMLAMETVVPVYFAVEDEALLSIYEQTQAASASQGSASAAEGEPGHCRAWVARVPVSMELSWASVFAVPTPAVALATGPSDPSPSAPSTAAHSHSQWFPDGDQRSPEPGGERLAYHQCGGELPPS